MPVPIEAIDLFLSKKKDMRKLNLEAGRQSALALLNRGPQL